MTPQERYERELEVNKKYKGIPWEELSEIRKDTWKSICELEGREYFMSERGRQIQV